MDSVRSLPGTTKLLLALILIGLGARVSTASDRRLVGIWHGEIAYAGQYGDLRYDKRHWLRIASPDGMGRTTYTYYSGSRFLAESVETFRWGLDGNTYWEQCISIHDDRGVHDCSTAPRNKLISSSTR